MPRQPRLIIPHAPYHVVQRGNNGCDVFYNNEDRKRYLDWLEHYSSRYLFSIIAYCLMPNHVHFVGIPKRKDSIAKTFQIVHMLHTQFLNKRKGWKGHLWHGRYYSMILDDSHLWTSIKYVEQNPVRANMVSRAEDYTWSSAAYHCGLRDDLIIDKSIELPGVFDNWQQQLSIVLDRDPAE